jgi:hypothetical protein
VPDRAVGTLLIAPLSLALLAVVQCGVFRMYAQVIGEAPPDQGAAA